MDDVFVHSFYWDALQDPALTVHVAALIQATQQTLLTVTRRVRLLSWPCVCRRLHLVLALLG